MLGCGGGGGVGTGGVGSPGGGGEGSPVPTSIIVTTSTNKAASGDQITLSAAVTSPRATTGTVTFWEQNNGGALAPSVTLVNGKAQAQVSLVLVGTHQVYAQYSGDAQNQTSQSGNLNIVTTGSAFVQISGTTGSLTHNVPVTVTIQ
jgi:hypothetical protein